MKPSEVLQKVANVVTSQKVKTGLNKVGEATASVVLYSVVSAGLGLVVKGLSKLTAKKGDSNTSTEVKS